MSDLIGIEILAHMIAGVDTNWTKFSSEQRDYYRSQAREMIRDAERAGYRDTWKAPADKAEAA